MKVKIEEGVIYPFKIVGVTVLPDETECYVLSDPNNVRHLIEKSPYEKYQFSLNQLVQCRIDKINCTGKIFIEPIHPVYKPGNKYSFPLIRFEDISIQKGVIQKMAVFSDIFQNEIFIPSEELSERFVPGNSYELNVVKIKKGRVILAGDTIDQDYKDFEPNQIYSFKIAHLTSFPGNFNFYLLASEEGMMYKLRSRYYSKYDFQIGQTIYCRFIRDDGEQFLEPQNPFYLPGNTYEFSIIRRDFITEYPERKKEVYILNNKSGKEIYIPVEEISLAKISNGKIKCKINDIRKSQLFLDCTDG